MITRATHVTIIVQCDAPSCDTPPIETITDTGLASILRGLGWYIGTETPPSCYCPTHTAMYQASGKLGAV